MSVIRIALDSLRDAKVRVLALLVVVGLIGGVGLLTAGAAMAGVGAQPGDLELLSAGAVVTSGPLSETPTWKATTACPAGYQVSAQVAEFTTGGSEVSIISPVQSAGLASSGFSGSLEGNVGALLAVGGFSASSPGTLEWAVGCWNGASGTGTGSTPVMWEQSTFVTVTSAGTFTTSSSGPTVPTATALTLSAPKVTYGHEQTEQVSVAVTASGGTPAGSVAVTSGSATVCTIRLASGAGSCAVPATQFAPGSAALKASYGGSSGFGPSTSSAQVFTVSQAKSQTSLTPSAAKATYGHEKSERLSVKVLPQYGGRPAGTVTIKTGRTTVCVIKLRSGKGTCTLSAKELRAGTYHFIADYAGNSDFAKSASAAKTVKVLK